MNNLLNKTIAVHNLGCKVNSYELDVMVEQLKAAGCSMVPFDEVADIYIINTCTVTNIADRKSRQMLHRAKHRSPEAIVVAVGCYVETDEKRIEEDPCIDLAVGNNRKTKIVQILEEYYAGHADEVTEMAREDLSKKPEFESMHLTSPGHTRAYIKIQDGCNQFCTYCIIPYARGRIRSRAMDEILEEIQGLAAEGVKEVVITGIHICSYGRDLGQEPEVALLELLRRIQLIAGITRIRLGSLEPRIMTEDFVKGIAGLSKLCPHFHLSLQSGCNDTLKRMNRHYTAEEYEAGVDCLRRYFDRPAITTDVIVGFAGETEEEFAQSKDFVDKIDFYEVHVFKYSVRHGTVAEKLPNQQTEQTKAKRSDILLALTDEQAGSYRSGFIGQEEELLLEEERTVDGKEYWTGHTMRYVEGLVPKTDDSNYQPGMLVKGIFTGKIDNTPYLLMETR